MGLLGKKKQVVSCCNANYSAQSMANAEKNKETGARVKILGFGCTKCRQLEENTLEALKQLGMDAIVDHVKDFAQIAAYGVMSTPALVVDGKVVSYGKVLSIQEAIGLLKKVQ